MNIMRLKDGYGTKMSQHQVSELNNGFIKMLTITQALIKDTPIIILEEPTNTLLQQNLISLYHAKFQISIK